MICILHGYLLDGSGSNLWTQSILRTLCLEGQTVHVMCQEPHPEKFEYIAEATRYDQDLRPEVILRRQVDFPGACIMHKPTLGPVLPVYVWDKYEEHDKVVPMVELDDATLEDYIQRNVALLDKIVTDHDITAMHVNHTVLMSVVAQRVGEKHHIPYSIMPHGSAIEYAVKKDERLFRYAADAVNKAGTIFVIGPEIRQRVNAVFPKMPGLEDKTVDLNLGVDTSLFEPIQPDQRAANLQRMEQALIGVERGKSPELTRSMRHRLGDAMGRQDLRRTLAQASDYTAKHTDTDCEKKLRAVDWEQEKILLFVGRLIASKGIHGVIAALPSILRKEPNTRLVVVGHGPLREPLEAMLWALDNGKRELFNNILLWGKYLEGAREPDPLTHVQRYLEQLEASGELDAYFETAQKLHISDRVIFTGYLTHRELCHLFPCCDVAVFPSIVAEAGPLVFLEAMASGVFPMGIYFAGMAASIDSVAGDVPAEVQELMKLRQEEQHTVADIVGDTLGALALDRAHVQDFRKVAVERYDWKAVGQKLRRTLEDLSRG